MFASWDTFWTFFFFFKLKMTKGQKVKTTVTSTIITEKLQIWFQCLWNCGVDSDMSMRKFMKKKNINLKLTVHVKRGSYKLQSKFRHSPLRHKPHLWIKMAKTTCSFHCRESLKPEEIRFVWQSAADNQIIPYALLNSAPLKFTLHDT